ncbi:MAG: alpha/beta fold hydrolase, partial [Planctomycetota bacterium]
GTVTIGDSVTIETQADGIYGPEEIGITVSALSSSDGSGGCGRAQVSFSAGQAINVDTAASQIHADTTVYTATSTELTISLVGHDYDRYTYDPPCSPAVVNNEYPDSIGLVDYEVTNGPGTIEQVDGRWYYVAPESIDGLTESVTITAVVDDANTDDRDDPENRDLTLDITVGQPTWEDGLAIGQDGEPGYPYSPQQDLSLISGSFPDGDVVVPGSTYQAGLSGFVGDLDDFIDPFGGPDDTQTTTAIADTVEVTWSISTGTIDPETGVFTVPQTGDFFSSSYPNPHVVITATIDDVAQLLEGEGGDRDDEPLVKQRTWQVYAPFWTPDTPITQTSQTASVFGPESVELGSASVGFSLGGAFEDFDRREDRSTSQSPSEQQQPDTLNVTWSVSGGGSIDPSSGVYTPPPAPDDPGSNTYGLAVITATVDDTAIIPAGEFGNRDDAPLSFSKAVTLYYTEYDEPYWIPASPIDTSQAQITSSNGTDEVVLGEVVTFSVTGSYTDDDKRIDPSGPDTTDADSFQDVVWSASAGQIDPATGEFTALLDPSDPEQVVTITATIDDSPKSTNGEAGSRDDPATELTYQIKLTPPIDLQIAGLSEEDEDTPDNAVLIGASTRDADQDDVLDFVDYDSAQAFTTATLTLDTELQNVDLAQSEVRLDYTGPSSLTSDPLAVAAGMRVWFKDGSQSRSASDYWKPGESLSLQEIITRSGIDLSAGSTLPLYLEALPGFDAEPIEVIATADLIADDWDDSQPEFADASYAKPLTSWSFIDADRDGTIRNDQSDQTVSSDPFWFWLNDDADRYVEDYPNGKSADAIMDDPSAQQADSEVDGIGWNSGVSDAETRRVIQRDLEDFTRLGVWVSPDAWIEADELRFTLDAAMGAPELAIYTMPGAPARGSGGEGTLDAWNHVTDATQSVQVANAVYSPLSTDAAYRVITSGQSVSVDRSELDNPSKGWRGFDDGDAYLIPLLFEGLEAGVGTIEIEFLLAGDVLAASAFDLELLSIDELYEHWTPGGQTPKFSSYTDDPKQAATAIPTTASIYKGAGAQAYASTDETFVFVHGWNMPTDARELYAETSFKRLYWQGYTGLAALYDWPTTDNPDGLWGGAAAWDSSNFNRGEETAWYSAEALADMLTKLDQQRSGNLVALAHSQGGVVASEAMVHLGAAATVDSLILSQAAVGSHFYDATVTPYHTGGWGYTNLNELGTATTPPGGQTYMDYHGLPDAGGPTPRFANIDLGGQRNIINFFNPADDALGWWRVNQENTRAAWGGGLQGFLGDGFNGAEYSEPASGVYTREDNSGVVTTLMPGVDDYELFAHVHASAALAIGAQNINLASSPFVAEFDMQALWGFTLKSSDHSRQFNETSADVIDYWNRVYQELI